MRLFFLPLAVLIAPLLGCESTPAPPTSPAAVGIVTIQVDRGDETPQTIEIRDVVDGATLESVMRSIEEVKIDLSGSGSTAFVSGIGDLKTAGDKGWTFKVDGEFASQGIGQTRLHPPTTVQWSYGSFEM